MDVGFDKKKAEPDIVDNREFTMASVLNVNLPRIGFLDVSSGYFDVDGYGMVRRTLEEAAADPKFSFRLMVGRDAIRLPDFDTFEEYRLRAETSGDALEYGLEDTPMKMECVGVVAGLIGLLKRDNVQVRRGGARFNHAKCYILGNEGFVVGSSNFTRAGLERNDELNAGVYATGTWSKVREWYERMWREAADAKGEMVRVLEQSKFGVPATPYEIYLKMLFEKYKKILTAMTKSDAVAVRTLAKFQRDAVYSLLQTIDERGGAILADSTGLGKTHIGLEVMHKKIAEGKRVLLIAPAQIRDTVWAGKLKDAQISAEVVGAEELGRKNFGVTRFKKYDFIVIDESQNFRSGVTGRWRNLMKMVTLGGRKQVLLMSATPVNNSLMDLYYQISVITAGRDDLFVDIGIPDLYGYMKKAAGHKLGDGLGKIQLLLDTIMVRRTRTFIRDVYPDERIDGKAVTFPERDYKPVRYGMTDIFGNVYRDLLDTINSLHMVPYGVERYNTTLTDEERRKYAVLAHLQVILLLKRFESSVNAIMISLKNKIALFEYFGDLLKKGRIVSPRQLNKIMLKWNAHDAEGDNEGEERDEFFMDEIRELPVQGTEDYDVESMRANIESDLHHLRRYRDSLKDMPKFDKKADAVAETILRDGALDKEGRKVLVFTEYTATATYLKKFMEDKFGGKSVGLITGSVNKSKRSEIIRKFSPAANTTDDEERPADEIDILVSTEVLSEGQNLQDCNYVVNYDLPWNPMRIVQRIGRIDRLTSMHDTVRSRECFPDEKLDELLTLVGKLMDKISDINESIGLDADLLGQEASPKNFKGTAVGRIRALAGGEAGRMTDELERESDLMPVLSPMNEISQYIKKAGIMKMERFAMGRRSGKRGDGQEAVLTYVREMPRRRFYSVVYDRDAGRAEVVDDMDAIQRAKCHEGDGVYLPMDVADNTESFRLLLDADAAARGEIAKQNSMDHKMARQLRAKPKRNARTIEKAREIILDEMAEGNLTEADANEAFGILDSPSVLQWGDELESLLDEYCDKKKIGPAVDRLRRIGKNIDIKTDEGEDEMVEDPAKLVLVGALLISK